MASSAGKYKSLVKIEYYFELKVGSYEALKCHCESILFKKLFQNDRKLYPQVKKNYKVKKCTRYLPKFKSFQKSFMFINHFDYFCGYSN